MQDFDGFRRLALRYWERRRLIYNMALIPPALIGYFSAGLLSAAVGDPPRIGTGMVIGLFMLSAIGANVCYSFAYALEFLVGNDRPNSSWLLWGRSAAFILGTSFAAGLALLGGRNIGLIEFS